MLWPPTNVHDQSNPRAMIPCAQTHAVPMLRLSGRIKLGARRGKRHQWRATGTELLLGQEGKAIPSKFGDGSFAKIRTGRSRNGMAFFPAKPKSASRARARIVSLRQPGDPAVNRTHGFASPPYGGFASSGMMKPDQQSHCAK